MSTLDEITKEKQRVSEVLARVDAQREKLAMRRPPLRTRSVMRIPHIDLAVTQSYDTRVRERR